MSDTSDSWFDVGLDTIPIITPMRAFGKEHHRSLPSLPQLTCVSSAIEGRLLITWWAREIYLWQIPEVKRSLDAFDDNAANAQRQKKLLSKIELQVSLIQPMFRRDCLTFVRARTP